MPCLTGEKSALAPVAPAIAGERAVLAHDPMARNGQRDPVRGARFADRIRFVRFADALGDLASGSPWRLPESRERLPDALLEGRALDIERQIQAARRVLDQGYDLGKDGLQAGIIGDRVGIETLVQARALRSPDRLERDGAHPLVAHRDQDSPRLHSPIVKRMALSIRVMVQLLCKTALTVSLAGRPRAPLLAVEFGAAGCSLGIVKNDAERVPAPGPDPADAVPQVHPIVALRAADRAVMDRERDSIALAKRHHLRPRLHARALLGQDELAAGVVPAGSDRRIATCSGKARSPYRSWCRQL